MEGMKYGYAHVSTDDQTPALQLAALKKAGWKTIFKDDGLSGATIKRPALQRCLKKLEPSDMLMVWELDRLGRSQALAPANRATRRPAPQTRAETCFYRLMYPHLPL
jgi:DNA invertase Pin-like site-specific DNA recombinase